MPSAVNSIPFSPYDEAVKLGAASFEGGINWTWVSFKDESAIAVFISQCQQKGYRTRGEYIDPAGNYAVQFHHYAD